MKNQKTLTEKINAFSMLPEEIIAKHFDVVCYPLPRQPYSETCYLLKQEKNKPFTAAIYESFELLRTNKTGTMIIVKPIDRLIEVLEHHYLLESLENEK